MIYFQYYPAYVNSTRPVGIISLEDFVKSIKSPSEKIKSIFEQIAQAETAGNMELKSQLKQNNLFYFTPCVLLDGKRKYDRIYQFNGVAVLDFDHIDNAPAFKEHVFNYFPFIICAFLSPSKKGVKFLVKIPVVSSTDEFKEYFYGLGQLFEMYRGWDGTPQNCVLPLFLSYDENILYRENAATWSKKGKTLNSFKESLLPTVTVDTTDEDKRIILENCQKAFEKIIDNGHPQVIATGVSLGGYVASGYLDKTEAEQFIFSLVQSNNYLRKGVDGYCKTAKTAIETGMRSQIILRK